MAGDVEAEELLFVPELFCERPGGKVDGVAVCFWRGRKVQVAKQGDLATSPVSMRRCPGSQGLINLRKQFRTVPPGEIECTSSNKVLQYLAVDRPGIQTAAVIL